MRISTSCSLSFGLQNSRIPNGAYVSLTWFNVNSETKVPIPGCDGVVDGGMKYVNANKVGGCRLVVLVLDCGNTSFSSPMRWRFLGNDTAAGSLPTVWTRVHTVGYLRQIPYRAALEPSKALGPPGPWGFAIRTSFQEIVISQAPTEETVKNIGSSGIANAFFRRSNKGVMNGVQQGGQ